MARFNAWLRWWKEYIVTHPRVGVNIGLVLLGFAGFLYFVFCPIDVLRNWQIELTDVREYRVVDGKRYAVYHPGDTLIFSSSSEKLMNANGTTSRMFVCEATAEKGEREIQLDTIPAVRPSGINPKRDNAIVVPDVASFDGLPRYCKIFFDIGYTDVILWRDHPEHGETERFIVEEEELDTNAIRKLINEANQRIATLEALLRARGETVSLPPIPETSAQTSSIPPVTNTTPQNPTTPTPAPPQKSVVDNVGDFIGDVGDNIKVVTDLVF